MRITTVLNSKPRSAAQPIGRVNHLSRAGTMSKPFFSIVIANFNYGTFLGRAVDSVLEQSCDDHEIIVVEGGSTDDSVRVIRDRESRVAWWCSERDRGQSDAFNKGFARADGEFLTWLNADDVMLPRTLEKAKRFLVRHPGCRWLCGNTLFVDDRLTIQRCAAGPHWCGPIMRQVAPCVYGPSSFFHRDIFAASRGFDTQLHFGMDGDLWAQFQQMGIEYRRLAHYCWAFRVHHQSKTSNAFVAASEDFQAERDLVERRFKARRGQMAKLLLKGLKAATAYPVSCFDSWRFRGMALDAYERLNR